MRFFMPNTFKKYEKLVSKKQIDLLFSSSVSKFCYPVKLLYIVEKNSTENEKKVLFSVPKKNIKNATDRNRIKRQMREAYRKNKSNFYLRNGRINFAFIYIEKYPLDYALIENAIIQHINKLIHIFDKEQS